jgi:hypothetical protein
MSLVSSILTSPAAELRPILVAELAANPNLSEAGAQAKITAWANAQLGSGLAGSLAKPVVDLFIDLYLPQIYADVVKQTLGTSDGSAALAAQGAASQEATATPSATFPVISANADGSQSVTS